VVEVIPELRKRVEGVSIPSMIDIDLHNPIEIARFDDILFC